MCRDSTTTRRLASRRLRHSVLLAAGVAASLALGCSRHPTEHTPSGTVADTLTNGLPRALVPSLAGWAQAWRYAIPGFGPDSLARGVTSPFKFGYSWAGAGRISDNVRTRALVDVLSPDSTRSLDFDMYLDFDRGDDGKILLLHEPDSAPVLADFRSDTLRQVAFCGTTCFYDGAYWVDNERFALTGATQSGNQNDGPWQAFLEIYDLQTRRMISWVARPVDSGGFGRYRASRDSALIARLERARFKAATPDARSRVGLTDRSQ
jgi:hypothetical protein